MAGVRKHLITYSEPGHFTILAERPEGLGGKISPKMDHLVCFMPGTIALGVTGGKTIEEIKKAGKWGEKEESEMNLATELTKTCWGMYKVMVTGLAPEISHFRIKDPAHMESDGILASASTTEKAKDEYIIKHNDNHNLQRPETVESLYYMWRITADTKYREWGWEMFQSFIEYTKADGDGGFTSLAHANEVPPILKDNMESFWLVGVSFTCSELTLTRDCPGRNAEVFLPSILAERSSAIRLDCHQYRSAHLPTLQVGQGSTYRMEAERERCPRKHRTNAEHGDCC